MYTTHMSITIRIFFQDFQEYVEEDVNHAFKENPSEYNLSQSFPINFNQLKKNAAGIPA